MVVGPGNELSDYLTTLLFRSLGGLRFRCRRGDLLLGSLFLQLGDDLLFDGAVRFGRRKAHVPPQLVEAPAFFERALLELAQLRPRRRMSLSHATEGQVVGGFETAPH